MAVCFLTIYHTPALTQFSFQSHQLLFSHTSEVRGENTPVRKFASTEYQTHNHQVMSQAHSPLSHPGGAGKSLGLHCLPFLLIFQYP